MNDYCNGIAYATGSITKEKEKKIQYMQNKIDDKYIGKTCAIYYQSRAEIEDILRFLDGYPKNVRIWNQWKQVIQSV